MSVVKINVLSVPAGSEAELEKRFAARAHSVDGAPGFEGFQLLRPVAGESRYFVVTTWSSETDFQAWLATRSPREQQPVSTADAMLEFEVVDLP